MEFVDIHNHVLYGLDDGAKSIEETILMLKMAQVNNIKQLVVTPHFKENVVLNTVEIINERFLQVEQLIKEQHIAIDIYKGCEIFLSRKTAELLSEGTIQTMNDTGYILVETHRNSTFMVYDLFEELYNLSVDNYKIILAHPERYELVHENLNNVYNLIKEGHLIQVNVTSLDEKHPNYRLVRKMLDHHLVQFIASDAHDLHNRPLNLDKGFKMVSERYGQNYAEELFFKNPLKVINNETIDISSCEKVKDRKWFIF